MTEGFPAEAASGDGPSWFMYRAVFYFQRLQHSAAVSFFIKFSGKNSYSGQIFTQAASLAEAA